MPPQLRIGYQAGQHTFSPTKPQPPHDFNSMPVKQINPPAQCLHPMGHFYEVPNLLLNGTLRLLLQERPILVTLDLSMPGMDGYEVLDFIRNTAEIAHTKVIVVSALDENALDKALARGADKVLRKPFSNEQLLTAVKELVN